MTTHDAAHWNSRYRQCDDDDTPRACEVLAENRHLLPVQGDAIDIAAGRGGNALLLAAAGLKTSAWDFSEVALQTLEQLAGDSGLTINTEVRDVLQSPPSPASFDVIVVSYFLERDLAPSLVAALRHGGLLFYQTFTRERTTDHGPRNPDYRLEVNELLGLFSGLRLVHYHEEGLYGDMNRGFRDRVQYIGCKDDRFHQI